VARNQTELEESRREQQLLRQELESLNSLLRQGSGGELESDARLLARLGQVERKIDQLLLSQDDNQEFMRSISARVDMLATRLGVPTVGEFKTMGAAPGVDAAPLDALPEEGRAIYQAAMLDRSRGNVEAARAGLDEFLGKYGRTELADDALYWRAELDYGEGDHEAALPNFRRLLVENPETEWRADALLKIGYCLLAEGDAAEGRATLERLVEEFPGSETAALAAQRLSGDQ